MKPHEEWFIKAEHDIRSSEHLLSAPTPLFDIAIYHTQQCAEKALKAYLAYKDNDILKTHNLKMLVERCIESDESFNEIIDDCIYLSPFATLYRYPDGDFMPAKEEVEKSISIAKKILSFVKFKI